MKKHNKFILSFTTLIISQTVLAGIGNDSNSITSAFGTIIGSPAAIVTCEPWDGGECDISISNIGNTGQNTIHSAIATVKSSVDAAQATANTAVNKADVIQAIANNALNEALNNKSTVSSSSNNLVVNKTGNNYDLSLTGLATTTELDTVKNIANNALNEATNNKTTVSSSSANLIVRKNGNNYDLSTTGLATATELDAVRTIANTATSKAEAAQTTANTAVSKADTAQATADNAHTRINELNSKAVQYNTDGDLVELHSNNGKGTKISNVKNGDVSANSLDAVNGSQLHAVKVIADTAVANANNNTTNINSNRVRIEKLEQSNFSAHNRINELDSKINKNRKRSDAGIAGVAAIAVIPQVTQASEFGIGVGTATKNGQTAIAVGASKASSNNKHIVKVAFSYDSQHSFTGAAGYLYKW